MAPHLPRSPFALQPKGQYPGLPFAASEGPPTVRARCDSGTWRREEGVHGRGRANQGVVLGVPTHVVEGSSNCFFFC
ncbi:hypothetical protein F383_20991 [Gossypium arboreum]|uniref:Uncharacterized protein n=1 Tax=Gossypium arboreum TaxID=29729 RepID=A0A0B0NZH3_GOSAR|nr:hypothetical protein F383_20991 [Gossypium arboreum]